MDYVLDTYALMAYLRREKSFQVVREVILKTLQGNCSSFISVINLGELYYMQAQKRSNQSGAIHEICQTRGNYD
jgi:predicted nucleic acid-binding protein